MNVPTSYSSAKEFLGDCESRMVRSKRATTVKKVDNTYQIIYHSTPVVTFHPDDSITINSGGWRSATTKNRINEAIGKIAVVWQNKFEWYLFDRTTNTKSDFEDGIRINRLAGSR